MRDGDSESMDSVDGQKEAIAHLHDALEADEAGEKDFHVKQALQLLDADEVLS